MKISELIDSLRSLEKKHGDIRVVVSGYEGGYNNIVEIEHLIVVDYYTEWWYGRYEDSSSALPEENQEQIPVILMVGGRGEN